MTQDYDKLVPEYFSKQQEYDKPSPEFFRKEGNQWTPVDNLAPLENKTSRPANLKPRT